MAPASHGSFRSQEQRVPAPPVARGRIGSPRRGRFNEPLLAAGALTVREVKMSPDLRLATLYVMPLGGKARQEALAALERNKKALRAEIARRVNLKFAADLRFVLDDSYDAAARIDEILHSPRVARDLKGPEPHDG
jgi:ribosome-binding factor A